MPVLMDTEDIYSDNDTPLRLEFDLAGLETSADNKSEGWIYYEMSLMAGKNILVKTEGTIHDNDVKFLEKTFATLPKEDLDYAPLEPDFELGIKYVENLEEWVINCRVNYGHVKHAYYGKSSIDFHILVSHLVATDFAKELKAQRIALTNNTNFKNYDAKQLDQKSPKVN